MRTVTLLSLVATVVATAGCGGAGTGQDPSAIVSPQPTHSASPSVAPSPSLAPTSSVTARASTGPASARPSALAVTASSRPSPRPPATPLRLTEASSGTTVRLRVGQSVRVSLPGGANGGYHPPSSSDGSVARPTAASGGYPTAQPAQATFLAVRQGPADLSSTTDFTCLHTTPRCLPPQKQWIVHLVVSM